MKKFRSEEIYYYLLFFFAASISAGFTIISHTAAALLIFWVLSRKYFSTYSSQLKLPQVWLPLLIYLFVLIDFFFSANQTKAFSTLSVYAPYLIPAFIIAGPALDEKQQHWLLKIFIIMLCIGLTACDIYAVADILITGKDHVLLDSINAAKYSSFGLTRLFPNWHPTYVSLFALWSIAFMLTSRFQYKKNLFKKGLEVVFVIFLLVHIFLLNSIAVLIALFAITIFWIIKYLWKKRPAYAIAILVLLFVAVPVLFFTNPFHNQKLKTLKETKFKVTDKEEERNFITIRFAKWVSHIDVFKKNLVLGTTPGDIQDERKKVYAERGFNELLSHNYNAHNQYLEMLCRFGIIGFALFLALLLIPFFNKDRSPFYFPFFLTTAIVFLTESFLENQLGLMSFFFFYGLLNKPIKKLISF